MFLDAVIINEFGDMIVRPSYVEFAASQSLPFQSRVLEHFLASYQASFIAICSAQYRGKAFKGGLEVDISLVTLKCMSICLTSPANPSPSSLNLSELGCK